MKIPILWDAQAWTDASGPLTAEAAISLLHTELRTITEHWSELYSDRLDLNNQLGNALHREQHCQSQIEHLKRELQWANDRHLKSKENNNG